MVKEIALLARLALCLWLQRSSQIGRAPYAPSPVKRQIAWFRLVGTLAFVFASLLTTVSLQLYAQDQPITNPVPQPIPDGGLRLQLVEWVTIPPSSSDAPRARTSFITHANDGQERLFANDLRGYLYVIKNKQVALYLDLKAQFPDFVDTPGLGMGFAFFAMHPGFASNGKFYTIHSEAKGALSSKTPDYLPSGSVLFHGVLTEWTTTTPLADQFPVTGSKRELLRIGFPSRFHNLQQIAFHPHQQPGDPDYGLLYLALGDGEAQSAATWTDAAQNLARPYGKILRIDPSGSNSPNGRYGIPADNPFVGQTGKLGEIWAYGFRNPHRFSWDTGGSGKMILTNIGEHNIEAIYLGAPGANYGWNEREGPFLFKRTDATRVYPLPTNDATFGYTYPVAMYDHDEGDGIVGGFVYRGSAIPELVGHYLFGDIVNGRLFYVNESALTPAAATPGQQAPIAELKLLNPQGNPTTLLQLVAPGNRVDLRFGVDAAGELFVSTKQTGQVWRLARVGGNATATPTPTPAPGTATSTPTTTITPSEATTTATPASTVTGSVTPLPPTTGTPSPTVMATITTTVTAIATFTPNPPDATRLHSYLPWAGSIGQ